MARPRKTFNAPAPAAAAAARGMIAAVFADDAPQVAAFLRQGVSPEVRDAEGNTPINWAAWKGQTEIVRLLVAHGAGLNERDNTGNTPLAWAAWKGHVETVRLLLENGAVADVRDKNDGDTPLINAARYGFTEIVRLLVAHGARVDLKNKHGYTALDYARSADDHEEIKDILQEAAARQAAERAGKKAERLQKKIDAAAGPLRKPVPYRGPLKFR